MIRIKYKNKNRTRYNLIHYFPEYINDLRDLEVIKVRITDITSYETTGLFCKSGCGTFADTSMSNNYENGVINLYINRWNINKIDTYDELRDYYYTCDEMIIKNIIL